MLKSAKGLASSNTGYAADEKYMDKLAEDVAAAVINKLLASASDYSPSMGEKILYWLQEPTYRQIYPTPFDIETTMIA